MNIKITKWLKFQIFGEILGNAIKSSISTILTIGGFVVLFSVIISILTTSGIFDILSSTLLNFNISKETSNSLFAGILELTNGLKYAQKIPNLNLSLLLSSFLLGFGGLSVLLQVYSIIAKEGISIRPYIYGKFLQGLFSVFITFILI